MYISSLLPASLKVKTEKYFTKNEERNKATSKIIRNLKKD
jgi:hypothetical protein